jgi:hypothetical protein
VSSVKPNDDDGENGSYRNTDTLETRPLLHGPFLKTSLDTSAMKAAFPTIISHSSVEKLQDS